MISYLILDFGSFFPYLAAAAATPLLAAFIGQTPDAENGRITIEIAGMGRIHARSGNARAGYSDIPLQWSHSFLVGRSSTCSSGIKGLKIRPYAFPIGEWRSASAPSGQNLSALESATLSKQQDAKQP
ncbi:MAG: hypothetical protein R3C11_16400 [Planctomycetaceae bacterium]